MSDSKSCFGTYVLANNIYNIEAFKKKYQTIYRRLQFAFSSESSISFAFTDDHCVICEFLIPSTTPKKFDELYNDLYESLKCEFPSIKLLYRVYGEEEWKL